MSTSSAESKALRCAIYCRKSSDEGLGVQHFSSIDAQRESGEHYVASRKHEGWIALPERYDDFGFSGGNLDRPAMQRLMADVKAKKIDCVVIYKLDRLTRSIRDFGNVMDAFDKAGVRLAVVTQAINSTDSMGRLMVNVLMSFAQFERELASERTRDKIAASRKKGLWTGGRPMLGYDMQKGRLVLNETEAVQVRRIFADYLELGSVRDVLRALDARGVRMKTWTSQTGKAMGGGKWVLSRLADLLGNVLYIGKVPHHGQVYPGEHPAIVDDDTFRRVQELLAENARCGATTKRNTHHGLLKGLVKCARCGSPMIHNVSVKNGTASHRYYECRARTLGGTKGACKGRRVPAGELEEFVLGKLKPRLTAPALVTRVLDESRAADERRLRDLDKAREALEGQIEALDAEATRGSAKAASGSAEASRSLTRLEQEYGAINRGLVSRSDVESGLKDFSAIWSCLSPTERTTLVAAVVERVECDTAGGRITIVERSKRGKAGEEAA